MVAGDDRCCRLTWIHPFGVVYQRDSRGRCPWCDYGIERVILALAADSPNPAAQCGECGRRKRSVRPRHVSPVPLCGECHDRIGRDGGWPDLERLRAAVSPNPHEPARDSEWPNPERSRPKPHEEFCAGEANHAGPCMRNTNPSRPVWDLVSTYGVVERRFLRSAFLKTRSADGDWSASIIRHGFFSPESGGVQ